MQKPLAPVTMQAATETILYFTNDMQILYSTTNNFSVQRQQIFISFKQT